MRALCDSGASRIALGRVGLQIASECAKLLRLTTKEGHGLLTARVPTFSITSSYLSTSPAFVATSMLIIVGELEADCLLNADFMRKFNAIMEEDGAGAIHLDSVGLADLDEAQRERIQALLERLLPATEAPLGGTKWAEHNIEITSSRPIKQKYYLVSRNLEGEMHEHMRQILEAGIVVKSNSEWSSSVVMHRKPNGKYRFCIDFRKLNAIT